MFRNVRVWTLMAFTEKAEGRRLSPPTLSEVPPYMARASAH
jgi:hypothetical protein